MQRTLPRVQGSRLTAVVEGVAQLIARDSTVHGARGCPGGLLSHHAAHCMLQACIFPGGLQRQQQQGFSR